MEQPFTTSRQTAYSLLPCPSPSFQAGLKENGILLNVIVFADYQLPSQPEKVVIGVDSEGTSYILEPEGQFSTSSEPVLITQVSLHFIISQSPFHY